MKNAGFTLLELITVLAIVGLLSLISYPSYNRHLSKVRRSYIAITLMEVAGRMENYYIANSSYQNASLEKLDIDDTNYKKHYNISVISDRDSYKLKATPINSQATDILCNSLIINQDGDKNITGSGNALECWG